MDSDIEQQQGDRRGARDADSWGEPSGVLARREVCRTSSVERIRDDLAELFYPARIETLSRGGLQPSLLSASRLDHMTIGLLRFGSDVMVDPGVLGGYHVNVPITGSVASICGDRSTMATPRLGAVFTPREHTVLPQWSQGAAQLCVKISRAAVHGQLEALLGHPVADDLRFALSFDLTSPAAQSWLGLLRHLVEELDRPGGLLETSPLYREHAEKLLIGALLWAQPHDFVDELREPHRAARPRTVKRVVDLIESNPETPYTLADLARHAGVGARRLQATFQETMRTSPMEYQRRVRLDHARRELLAGAESVMAVAHRWGFSNPGRFARYYHQAFGESPSETMRRAGSPGAGTVSW